MRFGFWWAAFAVCRGSRLLWPRLPWPWISLRGIPVSAVAFPRRSPPADSVGPFPLSELGLLHIVHCSIMYILHHVTYYCIFRQKQWKCRQEQPKVRLSGSEICNSPVLESILPWTEIQVPPETPHTIQQAP